MRYYRVNAEPPFLLTDGGEAKREAKARGVDFEALEIDTSKTGLKDFINELYASHVAPALAVDADPLFPNAPPAEPRQTAPSYAEQSIAWDELFPKLPVAHQLHFAAIAMENARLALPE